MMEGKAKADYARCVDISTRSAIKEMIVPGLLAIIAPVLIGFVLGGEALAGMLGGSMLQVCLAIMLANAGGAWDNAKKYIESGNYFGGKGSEAHAAG